MRNFIERLQGRRADPMEAARGAMRPPLRRRFYTAAGVTAHDGGFDIVLDGKPAMTPKRRPLTAPTRALGEALAAEWQAQREQIDPATMPLTRLANAVIDAVADAPQAVADEIAKYLGSDHVCYRAEGLEGLVARQAQHWDPVLAFARERLNARFVLAVGVVHVAQPEQALAAARAAIASDAGAQNVWRLGALAAITTLTGSALIALALAHGELSAEAAWAAAHVDEDWQMEQWGQDELALKQRTFRHGEFEAAARVLAHLASAD